MNAKIKDEFKQILQEFNLITKSDFERLSGEKAARFYENVKAALMEEYGLEEDDIESLINAEFYKEDKKSLPAKPLTFKQEIKSSIGKVLLANNHKIKYLSSGVIYFFKRFSEDLAFYICCRDCRKRENGIEVVFYFSPIHTADDTIRRLEVGIKINMGNIVEEDIIAQATDYGRKIISIENSIGCYEEVIMNEMRNPIIKTERLEYYMEHDYHYYHCFKNCKEIEEKWNLLHQNVIYDIKKNKFKNSKTICKEFIDSFDNEFFEKIGVDVSEDYFFDNFYSAVCTQCVLDA